MAIKTGDKIKVEYEGKFENGDVFDSSKNHDKPLEFTAGEGMVVKGFDSAVIGMEVGEEKEVTVRPEEAYGQFNKDAIRSFPKQGFPDGLKPGMMIGVPIPGGGQMPAKIADITETEVTIDLNHPLAGKTLIFKIKILEIL